MSLITEALKTAQREKTAANAGPSMERKLLEGFFPYAGGAAAPGGRRTALLVGASAVVILGAVAGGTLYLRRNAAAAPTPARPTSLPTRPPVAKAPSNKPAPRVVQAGVSQTSPVSADKSAPSADVESRTVADKPVPDSATPPHRAPRARSQVAIPVVRTDSDVAARPALEPAAPSPPATSVTVSAGAVRPGDQLFADAYAAHQAGNLDRAQELYEKAIAAPPVSADVFNNYGALLAQRGNVDGAKTMYRRAIAIDRDNVKAWINLGAALDQSGIHGEATSAFEQALKLDPNNVPVKLELAKQYQALGDTASGKRLIGDALRLAPKDPMAHYAMAALLEHQRDTVGALREFDAFIEFGSSAFPAETLDQVRRHEAALRERRP